MLWVLFAVVTAVALAAVLHPLMSARAEGAAPPAEADFYRAQLAEIERDVGRGLLTEQDAESARLEAARRLLAAAPDAATKAAGGGLRKAAAAAIVVLAPLLTVGLYLQLGSPDRPDLPLSARVTDDPAKMDVTTAVAKVEDHLRKNPEDGRGYEALAPVYMRLDRPRDAARAWGEAIRLLGETPDRLAALAEAQIFLSQGVVNAETRKLLDKALAGDPTEQRALYYSGLAAEQDGDKAKAIGLYEKLIAGVPESHAASLAGVRRRIAMLKGEDPAAAIAAMPKDQQTASIRGMVEGLAQRLSENGQDRQGWLRLVRAWSVLGETDKAKAALVDARKALAADPAAAGELDALARELGLEG